MGCPFQDFIQAGIIKASHIKTARRSPLRLIQTTHTATAIRLNLTLPQLVLSLLASLINEAGVPQQNITVFDASRFITDNIFNKCHNLFPEVIFVDNVGGDGRVKSEYVDNAIPYSVDNGKLATGLARCAVEADYLINMALLKGHVGQGVTLCARIIMELQASSMTGVKMPIITSTPTGKVKPAI